MSYIKGHKKNNNKLIWLWLIIFLFIGAYSFYTLRIKDIIYTPIYDLNYSKQYDAINIGFNDLPSSVRVVDKSIEFNNSTEQYPMASTVKLITALVIIDKIGQSNTDKSFVLNNNDLTITQKYKNMGGSVVDFNSGLNITYK